MNEDLKVPIILGCPFFATARAKIEVFNTRNSLKVGDDKVLLGDKFVSLNATYVCCINTVYAPGCVCVLEIQEEEQKEEFDILQIADDIFTYSVGKDRIYDGIEIHNVSKHEMRKAPTREEVNENIKNELELELLNFCLNIEPRQMRSHLKMNCMMSLQN